jgi:hypothetical protein
LLFIFPFIASPIPFLNRSNTLYKYQYDSYQSIFSIMRHLTLLFHRSDFSHPSKSINILQCDQIPLQ